VFEAVSSNGLNPDPSHQTRVLGFKILLNAFGLPRSTEKLVPNKILGDQERKPAKGEMDVWGSIVCVDRQHG